MKNALIYTSMTGHTKKIVTSIAKELGLTIYDVKKSPPLELEKLDVLFIAGGLYGGKPMPELQTYVSSLDPEKIGKVYILCSSTNPYGKLTQIEDIIREKGIALGEKTYHCRGSFLFFAFGHPNKTEIDGAVSFVKSIIG